MLPAGGRGWGGVGGHSPELQEEWPGGLVKTQVKFIRVVHSGQLWAACWSCHSLTQSAPWLPLYTLFRVTCVCHPTILSWRCKCETGNCLCWPGICHGQDARTLWFRKKFASSNFSPYMDLPLVPLSHTNPRRILWKHQPLQQNPFSPELRMQVFCCLWNFVCK